MSQLLLPVYRGEVEYIGKDDVEMRKDFQSWARQKYGLTLDFDPSDFYNPMSAFYCYPEYIQTRVNDALSIGKVIIGMDCNCWVVTAKENIVP